MKHVVLPALVLLIVTICYATNNSFSVKRTQTSAVYTVTSVDKSANAFYMTDFSFYNSDAAGGDDCYIEYGGPRTHPDGTIDQTATDFDIVPPGLTWHRHLNYPGVKVIYIGCEGANNSAVVYFNASDGSK